MASLSFHRLAGSTPAFQSPLQPQPHGRDKPSEWSPWVSGHAENSPGNSPIYHTHNYHHINGNLARTWAVAPHCLLSNTRILDCPLRSVAMTHSGGLLRSQCQRQRTSVRRWKKLSSHGEVSVCVYCKKRRTLQYQKHQIQV